MSHIYLRHCKKVEVFTFTLMSSEVIAGVHNLPPEHAGKVAHLHVGLHLGRFESIDVNSKVRVTKGPEIGLQVCQTILNGLIDCIRRKLGLHKYSQSNVVIQFPGIVE